MRIGIDIDDTLTNIKKDLDNAAIKYAKSIGKIFNEDKIEIEDSYNDGNIYKKIFNFNYEELQYFLRDIQESITENALPRPNVVEKIKKLKEQGHSIVIITARDEEFHDDPYEQSKEWLEKNDIYYDKLVVNARDKSLACMAENIDIFIDDSLSNCLKVSSLGIQTIRICDTKYKNEKVISFDNWIDIYNYIINEKIVKIVEYKKEFKDEINIFINKSMHDFIGRPYKERPDILDIENFYINTNGNFWCVIDVKTKRIVGTIALENRNKIGILKRFYVDKNYQGLKIGTQLYEMLEQYVKTKTNIKKIYLACGKVLKKAHAFYVKKGFKQIEHLDIDMHVAEDDDFFEKEITI